MVVHRARLNDVQAAHSPPLIHPVCGELPSSAEKMDERMDKPGARVGQLEAASDIQVPLRLARSCRHSAATPWLGRPEPTLLWVDVKGIEGGGGPEVVGEADEAKPAPGHHRAEDEQRADLAPVEDDHVAGGPDPRTPAPVVT